MHDRQGTQKESYLLNDWTKGKGTRAGGLGSDEIGMGRTPYIEIVRGRLGAQRRLSLATLRGSTAGADIQFCGGATCTTLRVEAMSMTQMLSM